MHLHIIINYVLVITNVLYNKQLVSTLGQVVCLINGIINTFENSKNSDSFSHIWKEIVTFFLENNVDLEIPTTCESFKFYIYKINCILNTNYGT